MTQSGGLFVSVKALLSTLLGMAQTRLELLANELEEERHHLIRLQFYGLLILFFFCMGMVLLTLLLIAAFWDTYRLQAIGLVAGGYLVIAALLAVSVVRRVRQKPRLFSASLAELAKDRSALDPAE